MRSLLQIYRILSGIQSAIGKGKVALRCGKLTHLVTIAGTLEFLNTQSRTPSLPRINADARGFKKKRPQAPEYSTGREGRVDMEGQEPKQGLQLPVSDSWQQQTLRLRHSLLE
jgi:hypothetical protein